MSASSTAATMPIAVIYADQNWLVVDKPAAVLAAPGRFADDRPVLSALLAAQGYQVFAPVHRLDYEVSGLMLLALHAQAHRLANAWFEKRLPQKTYEAWTEPSTIPWDEVALSWQCRLLRGKKRAYESPHGKDAHTRAHWQGTQEAFGQRWHRWELSPLTGRPHQLRYEMFRHQEPIAGDRLYGACAPWPYPHALALRAVRLSLAAVPSAERMGLPVLLETSGLAAHWQGSDGDLPTIGVTTDNNGR